MTLARTATPSAADIVCISHLKWDFVYQRPNHLMTRAARTRRVYFVQEPEWRGSTSRIEAFARDGLTVVVPVVPEGLRGDAIDATLRVEINRFLASEGVVRPWLWYYTPMSLPWTRQIAAEAVIYDCMDELSAFRDAPPELVERERMLLSRADVVYTGGQSLYEAKRGQHRNVFAFPSSVDGPHFRQARNGLAEPADQAGIARPRIGYFGVIDERIDLDLVAHLARSRPGWQIVMVGPTVKVADDDLPREPNIHWLGIKPYEQLPAYLAGWDVAIMPFALNESTRYISPTKTPEYLSGGRPVVSTPIRDVVKPYGEEGLVHIAADPDEFVAGVEKVLTDDRADLLRRADRFLATQSWDATWAQMEQMVNELTRPAAADVATPVARPVPAPSGVLGGAMPSAPQPLAGRSTSSVRSRQR